MVTPYNMHLSCWMSNSACMAISWNIISHCFAIMCFFYIESITQIDSAIDIWLPRHPRFLVRVSDICIESTNTIKHRVSHLCCIPCTTRLMSSWTTSLVYPCTIRLMGSCIVRLVSSLTSTSCKGYSNSYSLVSYPLSSPSCLGGLCFPKGVIAPLRRQYSQKYWDIFGPCVSLGFSLRSRILHSTHHDRWVTMFIKVFTWFSSCSNASPF